MRFIRLMLPVGVRFVPASYAFFVVAPATPANNYDRMIAFSASSRNSMEDLREEV